MGGDRRGNRRQGLIQAGFNESPDPNNPGNFIIQPWWKILPAAETYIANVQIQPGDQVTVSIDQISGTDWGITLTDDTNGELHHRSKLQRARLDGEWILEALTVSGKVPGWRRSRRSSRSATWGFRPRARNYRKSSWSKAALRCQRLRR